MTQAAEEVHYSMGLAIQDTQVAHTHGLLEVVGVGEVDTGLIQVDDRRVAVVAGFHMGEVEYMQALLVAEAVGNWKPGDEISWACSLGPVVVENSSFEPDEVARKKETSR